MGETKSPGEWEMDKPVFKSTEGHDPRKRDAENQQETFDPEQEIETAELDKSVLAKAEIVFKEAARSEALDWALKRIRKTATSLADLQEICDDYNHELGVKKDPDAEVDFSGTTGVKKVAQVVVGGKTYNIEQYTLGSEAIWPTLVE